MMRLDELSTEVRQLIFSFIQITDIGNVRRTCRLFACDIDISLTTKILLARISCTGGHPSLNKWPMCGYASTWFMSGPNAHPPPDKILQLAIKRMPISEGKAGTLSCKNLCFILAVRRLSSSHHAAQGHSSPENSIATVASASANGRFVGEIAESKSGVLKDSGEVPVCQSARTSDIQISLTSMSSANTAVGVIEGGDICAAPSATQSKPHLACKFQQRGKDDGNDSESNKGNVSLRENTSAANVVQKP
eukprot:CFRG0735T1